VLSDNGDLFMMKTRLAIAALAVTGLIGSPLAAEAKMHMHKHPKAHSTTTTGANLKSSGGTSGSTSTQGHVAPGTKTGIQPSGKQ
jgi:hypothetical protein